MQAPDVTAVVVEREDLAVDDLAHRGAVGPEQRQVGVDRQRRRREGVVATLDGAAGAATGERGEDRERSAALCGRAASSPQPTRISVLNTSAPPAREPVAVEGAKRRVAVAVDRVAADHAGASIAIRPRWWKKTRSSSARSVAWRPAFLIASSTSSIAA